jgi:hypothetical protein
VPQQSQAVLKNQGLANEKYLVLIYSYNVQHRALVVPLESLEKNTYSNGVAMNGTGHLNGSIKPHKNGAAKISSELVALSDAEELDLPLNCTIVNISCRHDDTRVFIQVTGYTLAGRIYKYKFYNGNSSSAPNGVTHNGSNCTTSHRPRKLYGELSVWRQSIVDGFEPDCWAVKQVWVPNPNDGVKIPMTIVHNKSLVKDSDSFCLLFGYHPEHTLLIVDTADSIYRLHHHSHPQGWRC